MGKDIIIQEGGIDRQLSVDRLKTRLVSGGSCRWVPEDEVALGTKHITQNGTYRAEDDGLYGYSRVTVSGVGVATGVAADGSGDAAVAKVDPATGEIVISKVPSSIKVTQPPTNAYGVYRDGQAITKDGMEVKAYYASGEEWGAVPIDAVTLDPTTAIYDEATDTAGQKTSTYDGQEVYYCQQDHAKLISSLSYTMTATDAQGTVYAAAGLNETGTMNVFLCSDKPFNYKLVEHAFNDRTKTGSAAAITRNGKTCYRCQGGTQQASYHPTADVPVNQMGGSLDTNMAAWIIVYGTVTDEGLAGSKQSIGVAWPREGDGLTLETAFEIRVAPPEENPEDPPAPHDDTTIYYEDVNEAINLALTGGDETVYFKGQTYTFEEAYALRDSSPHRLG